VRDLFQHKWDDRTVEIFSPGPDGGIDVRVLRSGERPVYIQCKHYAGSDFSTLYAAVEREASKVSKVVSGGDYWLATSRTLTAKNKDRLSMLFPDGFLPQERILSKYDLDALLDKYPQVELQNFKLYMTSVPVMQRLLHAETLFRQQGFFVDVRDRVRTFVQTPILQRARKILESKKACVITGEPGVGKTTLAEMLVLGLIDQGAECIPVSKDIEEAERLYNPSVKQVFYYDDFLGQTSFSDSKLGKNEDARIASFVARLQREEGHYLVLTTREYIFRQAAGVYEKIDSPLVKSRKLLLDLSAYTRADKVHILYNHLYYSVLDKKLLQAAFGGGRHRKVTNHRNFSPRLIELAIQLAVVEDVTGSAEDLVEYFVQVLDNPETLWKHAFNEHISQCARDILLVLASLPPSSGMDDVLEAVYSFQKDYHGKVELPHVVRRSITEMDGVFINSYLGTFLFQEEPTVVLANPSFRDYLHSYISVNPEVAVSLLSSAVRFEQASSILEWISLGHANYRRDRRSRIALMPTVRSAILVNGNLLTQTLLELANVRDCGVSGAGMRFSDRPVDKGERVRVIISSAVESSLSRSDLDSVVLACSEFLANAGWDSDLQRFDKSAALSALMYLQSGSGILCGKSAFDVFAASLERWFESSLDSPADFIDLSNLVDAVYDVKDDWYEENFREFIENCWQQVYPRDLSSLQEAYSEISEVADVLYYDVASELEEMKEEILEVENLETGDDDVANVGETMQLFDKSGRAAIDLGKGKSSSGMQNLFDVLE
jgi:energy-coupling factor transporter ATP-binding protein EcfA2